jgi:hypothetical protein
VDSKIKQNNLHLVAPRTMISLSVLEWLKFTSILVTKTTASKVGRSSAEFSLVYTGRVTVEGSEQESACLLDYRQMRSAQRQRND